MMEMCLHTLLKLAVGIFFLSISEKELTSAAVSVRSSTISFSSSTSSSTQTSPSSSFPSSSSTLTSTLQTAESSSPVSTSTSSNTETAESLSPVSTSTSSNTETAESSSPISTSTSSNTETAESSSPISTSTSSNTETTELLSPISTSTSANTETAESSSPVPTSTSSNTETAESSSPISTSTFSNTETAESSSQVSPLISSRRQTNESSTSSLSSISSNTLLLSSSSDATYSRCSWEAVSKRIQSCDYIIHDKMSNPIVTSELGKFCNELECNIKCYIDAVNKCDSNDEAFEFDPRMYTVLARGYCHIFTDSVRAFSLCTTNDPACFRTYESAVNALTRDHSSGISDYSKYKADYCNAASTFKSCISFSASGNCTHALSTLRQSLAEVSASFVGCGTGAQSNALFEKHSGSLRCGGDFIFPNFIHIMLAIIYNRL